MTDARLRDAIARRYGVSRTRSRDATINRAIRKAIPGGNELLDAIEWANACRNDSHRRGLGTGHADQVIDRLEAIRTAMADRICKEAREESNE